MTSYAIINALPTSEKNELVRNEDAPSQAFIGHLEYATSMLESLKHFEWKCDLCPPVNGTDEPTLEHKCKVTLIGLDFIRKNPGSGSVVPLDKFANVFLEMTKKKISTTAQSNMIEGAWCGFVRTCNNDFEGSNKIELQFDDNYDAMPICSLQLLLLDVMKKSRGLSNKIL